MQPFVGGCSNVSSHPPVLCIWLLKDEAIETSNLVEVWS